MPSVSKKQHNFMAAVAKNPKFAKKAGVPQSVGKEFLDEDKGKTFRQGGIGASTRAKMNRPRTNHGKMQFPNYGPKQSVAKKEGGVLTNNEKDKDMKKMNQGMMAMMAKKVTNEKNEMKRVGAKARNAKDEMKRVRGEEMVDKAKMMGMKKGGKAHSDMAKDKPMMKKVAATAVKGHEKKMHGMAKGGGIEIKGKTKGTMIKMKSGGSC
jgi:hypothetical protein